jgi:hypothetical protein
MPEPNPCVKLLKFKAGRIRILIMDLFGPFRINGRAVPTWLTPQLGDRISVLAGGLLSARVPGAAGNTVVTADGSPGLAPAPATWPGPNLQELSLIGVVNRFSWETE